MFGSLLALLNCTFCSIYKSIILCSLNLFIFSNSFDFCIGKFLAMREELQSHYPDPPHGNFDGCKSQLDIPCWALSAAEM